MELIEPVGRKVRLTAAGEILVRHAEQILRQLDRAEADLAATRSEITGSLKVATFQTAAIALIPDLLTIMSERHPRLTVYLTEIQPDVGTAALLAREFDLVLGEQYPGLEHPTPPRIEQRRPSTAVGGRRAAGLGRPPPIGLRSGRLGLRTQGESRPRVGRVRLSGGRVRATCAIRVGRSPRPGTAC